MKTGSEQYMIAISTAQGFIGVDMLLTAQYHLDVAQDICHNLEVEANIFQLFVGE